MNFLKALRESDHPDSGAWQLLGRHFPRAALGSLSVEERAVRVDELLQQPQLRESMSKHDPTPTETCANCGATLFGSLVSRCYKCDTAVQRAVLARPVRSYQEEQPEPAEKKKWWHFWR